MKKQDKRKTYYITWLEVGLALFILAVTITIISLAVWN